MYTLVLKLLVNMCVPAQETSVGEVTMAVGVSFCGNVSILRLVHATASVLFCSGFEFAFYLLVFLCIFGAGCVSGD